MATSIIVTLDKDLDLVPGEHYSWAISTTTWSKPAQFKSISKWEATSNFYSQMLIGDSTDNIFGIAGLGPVKSKKYLSSAENEQDLFDLVYNKYDDPKRFLMNGICLWICQEEGVTWAQKLQSSDLILPKELRQELDLTLESMKYFTSGT